MDLLKKLFFGVLVVALPSAEVARFPFNEVAITLLDISVITTVLLWFVLRRKIRRTNLTKPILVFVATLLISLVLNISRLSINEFLISTLYLIRWVFYVLIYYVILDLTLPKRTIEKTLTIGGAILVVVGFILYFLYPDLRNLRYAGWDEHLYRLFSTFLDPNFAGSFFVLYLLFLMNRLANKSDLIIKIISVLSFIAVILTFSRSAYLALVVGATMLFFLKRKTGFAIRILLAFVIAVLIALQLSPKSEGTKILRTASGEARLDSIKHAFTIFKDHPIFGIGFDSYRYAQKSYGFLDESRMIVHSGAGTDNSFLFILATAGIIGFLALSYLLFNMLLTKDPLVIASITALVVNSFFINSLFYPPIMLWMWVLLGLKKRA